MSTTRTTQHPLYRHEMGLYSSEAEFVDLLVPFARDGLAGGEAVVLAYDPVKTAALQRWLPPSDTLAYVTDTAPYERPGAAIATWKRLINERLAAGVARVRIAGDVPHPGSGRPYAGWDRYESAIDAAWGELPTWARCLYDERSAPANVLRRAASCHRRMIDRSGEPSDNPAFVQRRRLAQYLPPHPHPLEAGPPNIELHEPSPAMARATLGSIASGKLTGTERDDMLVAVSEAVENAFVHGESPVVVRIWADPDEIVVHVSDSGPGPDDPLAGLVPPPQGAVPRGRGLWLLHRLNVAVELLARPDRFTVRIRAGGD